MGYLGQQHYKAFSNRASSITKLPELSAAAYGNDNQIRSYIGSDHNAEEEGWMIAEPKVFTLSLNNQIIPENKIANSSKKQTTEKRKVADSFRTSPAKKATEF